MVTDLVVCKVCEQGTPVQSRDGPAAVNCRNFSEIASEVASLEVPLLVSGFHQTSEKAVNDAHGSESEDLPRNRRFRALSDWGDRCR